MQSQRMYAAMKGLGKDARLVMLPHESHGYRARESILHVLWEQEQWLKRYLMPLPSTEEIENIDLKWMEPLDIEPSDSTVEPSTTLQ